jgi:hypothetical protein
MFAAPSHQIHSIFGQFSAMQTGNGYSHGHGTFLFTPPSRPAPPPPKAPSSVRSSMKRSKSAAVIPMAPIQEVVAPSPSSAKRPGLKRNVIIPPSISPPPPYSAVEDKNPFANSKASSSPSLSASPSPAPSKRSESGSPPSYSYADQHAAAVDIVRKLAKEERDRRARVVASVLLTRNLRSSRSVRRQALTDTPVHTPRVYVRSGLSHAVHVGDTNTDVDA